MASLIPSSNIAPGATAAPAKPRIGVPMPGMMPGGVAKPMSRIQFDKYDADKSGFISKDEFKALCYDKGVILDETELIVAMNFIDTDGTGQIGYDEFEKWWKTEDRFAALQLDEYGQTMMAWVVTCFQHVDTDKSGKLTVEEFNQVFHMMKDNGYAVGDFGKCVGEIDRSGDGEINFNEFIAWIKNMGLFSPAADKAAMLS